MSRKRPVAAASLAVAVVLLSRTGIAAAQSPTNKLIVDDAFRRRLVEYRRELDEQLVGVDPRLLTSSRLSNPFNAGLHRKAFGRTREYEFSPYDRAARGHMNNFTLRNGHYYYLSGNFDAVRRLVRTGRDVLLWALDGQYERRTDAEGKELEITWDDSFEPTYSGQKSAAAAMGCYFTFDRYLAEKDPAESVVTSKDLQHAFDLLDLVARACDLTLKIDGPNDQWLRQARSDSPWNNQWLGAKPAAYAARAMILAQKIRPGLDYSRRIDLYGRYIRENLAHFRAKAFRERKSDGRYALYWGYKWRWPDEPVRMLRTTEDHTHGSMDIGELVHLWLLGYVEPDLMDEMCRAYRYSMMYVKVKTGKWHRRLYAERRPEFGRDLTDSLATDLPKLIFYSVWGKNELFFAERFNTYLLTKGRSKTLPASDYFAFAHYLYCNKAEIQASWSRWPDHP